MEKYTITKEQILEIYDRTSVHNQYQLKEWFPEAFKKELEVGVWYRNKNNALANYQGGINGYGFTIQGHWVFLEDIWSFDYPEKWKEATDEEVKEALKNEVIKRFGKDWETAEIEKCLVHGSPNYIALITTNKIWNKYGCIYKNGVFAEPLKSKVISIEKAEKILSKKYGQKVEIK